MEEKSCMQCDYRAGECENRQVKCIWWNKMVSPSKAQTCDNHHTAPGGQGHAHGRPCTHGRGRDMSDRPYMAWKLAQHIGTILRKRDGNYTVYLKDLPPELFEPFNALCGVPDTFFKPHRPTAPAVDVERTAYAEVWQRNQVELEAHT